MAYWSDWRLLGMDRDQWGSLHINLGFLFVLAVALHIVYNWTPILSYLKYGARAIRVFSPEFGLALKLRLAVAAGHRFEDDCQRLLEIACANGVASRSRSIPPDSVATLGSRAPIKGERMACFHQYDSDVSRGQQAGPDDVIPSIQKPAVIDKAFMPNRAG